MKFYPPTKSEEGDSLSQDDGGAGHGHFWGSFNIGA